MSDPDENESLRQQLRELEARVARLEAERALAKPEPPGPVPDSKSVAKSAPWPVTAPPIPIAPQAAEIAAPAIHAVRATVPDARQEVPHASTHGANKGDLEQFFALTVLGRVGIAAVVLAAAYFGQLGWTHLGPGARAALVYVFGSVMIVVGALLRRVVDQRYVALLWGGGVAVTYVAGVLAHLRFDVLPSWAAMVSLILSAALGQFLAYRLRLQLMATVALAGAYAAPVVVGTPSPTPTAFFVLLLSLHVWAAWTEHRWQWLQARALAVVATLVLVVAWYGENGTVSQWSFFWHLEAVWLLLALPELLRAAARRPVAVQRVWAVFLVGLVFHTATTFGAELRSELAQYAGGLLLLAGAWYVPRHVVMGQFLARMPAFLLTMGAVFWWATPMLTKRGGPAVEWQLVLMLAGVGGLQLALRRWTKVGELGCAIAAIVSLLALKAIPSQDGALSLAQAPLSLIAALLLLVFAKPAIGRITGLVVAVATALVVVLGVYEPSWSNQELVALALVSATAIATLGNWLSGYRSCQLLGMVATGLHALLLMAWLVYCAGTHTADDADAPVPFWNVRFFALTALVALVTVARTLLPFKEVQQRAVLGGVLLIACYVGGLLEVLDIIRDWTFGPHAVATSLYSMLFASVLLVLGFWKQMLALRWVALLLFGGVAVKVAAYDLSRAQTPVRVLVTGILGAVLLVVAWGYARRKRAGSDHQSTSL